MVISVCGGVIMPFSRPTLQEIVDRIISDMQSRITNSTTLLRRSVLRVLARVYAGAIHLVYGYLEFMKQQIFVSSSDAEYLEKQGYEYGIFRKAATVSAGSGIITGTAGIDIPAGTEFISDSGNIYTSDALVSLITASVDVDFTSEESGEAYNIDGPISLYFVSPIAGVDSEVVVVGNIEGGTDEEEDDDYRARVIARKRQPPHGGAEFDYEVWALEYPGVTRAWCIPEYMGIGTVGLAFVMDDQADIIPSVTEQDDVKDYLISHSEASTGKTVGVPVTAQPGLFVINNHLTDVNFQIAIYPDTASIRASVKSRLDDLMIASGGPEKTMYLSDIGNSIGSAAGLLTYRLISPAADLSFAADEVPVVGDILFSIY
jgi:uncharacterized phage protein gp47/JayE